MASKINKMRKVARELKRVVADGRIVCIVCDDTLIKGKKYPVVADLTKIYIEESRIKRMELSEDINRFLKFIEEVMEISGTCFELVSFAIVKTHMERFGCKVYRETRAEASDRGTDLSTDFGVVYQVKKHFKEFLLKLNVKPIVKNDLLNLVKLMDEVEIREKALRVIFEEMQREYQSDICRKCPFVHKFPTCEYRK